MSGAFLRIFLVEPSLGFGRFPEGNEAVVFAFTVVAYLEDEGVEATLYPADRAKLFRDVAPLVEVLGPLEEFLCFFESYRPFRIRAELRALFPIRIERALAGITVIPEFALCRQPDGHQIDLDSAE